MAIPTRENSGLEITINHKGTMSFSVGGVRVPTSEITIDGGKPLAMRGTVQITVLTQFVTFTHVDEPVKPPEEFGIV